MKPRKTTLERKTNETAITLGLNVDGSGVTAINTGVGFLDHLLGAFAKHGRFDLNLECQGDLIIDDHHTAEDSGIAIGQAFREALGDCVGITRFGSAYAPLDEALARAVVDVSGRPTACVDLGLTRDVIGTLACENVSHVLQSIAIAACITVHVDVLKGVNDHHRAEAAYKAFGLAMRAACASSGFGDIASTKGTLSPDKKA